MPVADQEEVRVIFKGEAAECDTRLAASRRGGQETQARGTKRGKMLVTTKKMMMERELKQIMQPSAAAASFAIFILNPETVYSSQELVTPIARAHRNPFQASTSHHVPVNSRLVMFSCSSSSIAAAAFEFSFASSSDLETAKAMFSCSSLS